MFLKGKIVIVDLITLSNSVFAIKNKVLEMRAEIFIPALVVMFIHGKIKRLLVME